ncbi:carboxypeptidase Q isoform X4 [Sminthopsis crassicaudata]
MAPLIFLFMGVFYLLPSCSGKALCEDVGHMKTFSEIKEEIAGYQDVAKAIIDLAVCGKAQNRSYERLALLVDTVGPRLSGSKNLEKAIQIMYQNLINDGLENVHLEPVKVPHWERGQESAVMLEPRNHSMAILGLGSSIGTPPEGITAEVLVVSSFDELHRRASEAKGKIVVYNQPYKDYGETAQYRVQGAVEAAKVGAVASLIRSVASFSIYSPHTGIQFYQDGVPQIPTACITVEDAEMMARMASRGTKIVIQLKMEAKNYPDTESFNTVAEITGSKYPEQHIKYESCWERKNQNKGKTTRETTTEAKENKKKIECVDLHSVSIILSLDADDAFHPKFIGIIEPLRRTKSFIVDHHTILLLLRTLYSLFCSSSVCTDLSRPF